MIYILEQFIGVYQTPKMEGRLGLNNIKNQLTVIIVSWKIMLLPERVFFCAVVRDKAEQVFSKWNIE